MQKILNQILLIVLFVIITTFLIWLPHILAVSNLFGLNFQNGFNTIYRNFDGLEYVIIAKTFYDPSKLAAIPQPLPAEYFAAHFPGFSLFISVFAPLFGHLKSMLLVSLMFTTLSAIAFYYLVKDFKLTTNPLLLTLVFLILPARWLIVRSVGSAEPMFIFFCLLTMYFFLKFTSIEKGYYILLSAIFASFAQLTRPPGVLLAGAIGIFVLWQAYQKKSFTFVLKFWPFILVPMTLLGVFYWYNIALGDFFAYFHSGDNIHLTFPPFQVFNINQAWVGSIWLEDVIYIFILGLLAGLLLIKRRLFPFAFFLLTYLIASMFVAHRDISRYTLPIVPFAIIAFEKILISKEFRIVLIILALAIYLYSQNFILQNTAPISNLSIYN